jgi:hypothetical protein
VQNFALQAGQRKTVSPIAGERETALDKLQRRFRGSSLDLNHDVGDRVLHLRVVGHRARMSATEFFFLTLSIARSHARSARPI